MQIKIKILKRTLLISACALFAGINYLTYVKADTTSLKSCNKTIDADCDGLTDAEEKLYGTDAHSSDSDGDSYSDGVEVKSGYDPTKPAPGDKIELSSANSVESGQKAAASEKYSLTDNFVAQLNSFVDSKDGEAVTKTDIQTFANGALSSEAGDPITWDSLPEFDQGAVKVLSQPYGALSETERKAKLQRDAEAYLTTASYLIVSNFPKTIQSQSDLDSFASDFQLHLASLATLNPDVAYFADLGNRLELFSNQLNALEVPESMVEIHIKFQRLIGGFLSLRNLPSPAQDPLANMIMLNRVQDLTDLSTDFFGNDFQNYFDQLKVEQK